MGRTQDIPFEEQSESERIRTTFGEVLRQRRKQAGYEQRPFARVVGISNSHLRRIESGETSPTVVTVCKMCAVLECATSSLFIELDDALMHPQRLQNK